MNRREIFDTVKDHLLTQRKVCKDKHGDCVYRNDGMRCAIGALIPDDFYDPGMEKSEGVMGLIEDFPELSLLWGVDCYEDVIFLADLQDLHDNSDVDSWEWELNRLERMYVEVVNPEKELKLK